MRAENDEIRCQAYRKPRIGRFEWLGIITLGVMLGLLLHDGVSVLIANAVARYELEQFRQEMNRLGAESRQHEMELEIAFLRAQEAATRAQRNRDCFYMSQAPQGAGNIPRSLLDKCR